MHAHRTVWASSVAALTIVLATTSHAARAQDAPAETAPATPAASGATQDTAGADAGVAAQPGATAAPGTDGGASAAPGTVTESPQDYLKRQRGSTAGSEPEPIDNTNPETSHLLGDQQAMTEEKLGVQHVRSGTDPYEDPHKRYLFLGAFYRHFFIPSGIFKLFVDEAPSVNGPQPGIEFSVRKKGFEILASAFYSDFGTTGPYRSKGDGLDETEIIHSKLKVVYGGVTFLWSTMFSKYIGLQYGVGLGVGVVLGDLIRTEAYPTVGGGYAACQTPTAGGQPGTARPGKPFDPTRVPAFGDVSDWCNPAVATRPGDPPPISNRDGQSGAHYGVKARRWSSGGSVPNVWFRAAPQLSLRIKPIHQLVIRVDTGFDVFSGVFVGGAIQVGL